MLFECVLVSCAVAAAAADSADDDASTTPFSIQQRDVYMIEWTLIAIGICAVIALILVLVLIIVVATRPTPKPTPERRPAYGSPLYLDDPLDRALRQNQQNQQTSRPAEQASPVQYQYPAPSTQLYARPPATPTPTPASPAQQPIQQAPPPQPSWTPPPAVNYYSEPNTPPPQPRPQPQPQQPAPVRLAQPAPSETVILRPVQQQQEQQRPLSTQSNQGTQTMSPVFTAGYPHHLANKGYGYEVSASVH